jgi:hypothetical protein
MNIINRGDIYYTETNRKKNIYISEIYILRIKVFSDSVLTCKITIEHRKLSEKEMSALINFPTYNKKINVLYKYYYYSKYRYYCDSMLLHGLDSFDYKKYEYIIEESDVENINITFFDGFDCDLLTIDKYIDDLFDIFCFDNEIKKIIKFEDILESKKFGLKKGIDGFLDYAKYIQPIIKKTVLQFLRDNDTICIGLKKSFEDRFIETLANIFVIKYIKPLFKENSEQKDCAHVKRR